MEMNNYLATPKTQSSAKEGSASSPSSLHLGSVRGDGVIFKKKWPSSFSSIKVLIISAQKCSTGGPKIESKSRPEEDGPLPSPVGLR